VPDVWPMASISSVFCAQVFLNIGNIHAMRHSLDALTHELLHSEQRDGAFGVVDPSWSARLGATGEISRENADAVLARACVRACALALRGPSTAVCAAGVRRLARAHPDSAERCPAARVHGARRQPRAGALLGRLGSHGADLRSESAAARSVRAPVSYTHSRTEDAVN
jgi:hypothetical protein